MQEPLSDKPKPSRTEGNYRRFVPTENFKVKSVFVPKHFKLIHKLERAYERETSPVRKARILKKYEALYNKYFKKGATE